MSLLLLRWSWKMLPCSRFNPTSSPTPATISPSLCNLVNRCFLRARPTSTTPPRSRWSWRGSSALSPTAEITVRLSITVNTEATICKLAEATMCNFSLLQRWSRTWRCGPRWKLEQRAVRLAAWGPRLTWSPTTAAWETPPCTAARRLATPALETPTST